MKNRKILSLISLLLSGIFLLTFSIMASDPVSDPVSESVSGPLPDPGSVPLPARGMLAGIVKDKITQEPIIGATVWIEGTTTGVATDHDGRYLLRLLPGNYNLVISFVGYTPVVVEGSPVQSGRETLLNVDLEESITELSGATVVAERRRGSEIAVISALKSSLVIMSGISSQQISKTQDRDASEVIRRVPGISIIDDKFVIVRGLAQRYNNVWINNAAVPSSEADTRSFSFDIIPGSQLENIMVVKSPAPELPADFTGGFIKIQTKDIPDQNATQFSYSMSVNDQTHFDDFKSQQGSPTDQLGFDNGMRNLQTGVPIRLDPSASEIVTTVTRSGFHNDWSIRTKNPLPDQRFNFLLNRKYSGADGARWGLVTALNYSNTSKTYANMENSRFGVYNHVEDKPEYLYQYTDNLFSQDVRVGGMLNLSYVPNEKNKFEFRNILNQLGRNRYTEREGYRNVSAIYIQEKREYLYMSRTTYSGQFNGTHTGLTGTLDWNLGYAYANKNQPDRRIINREENGFPESPYFGRMQVEPNDITRDFVRLDERMLSGGVNYSVDMKWSEGLNPTLKAGLYGEYRDRDYATRLFMYRWHQTNLSSDLFYRPVITDILTTNNFGSDKIYIYEDTDNRNNYSGKNLLLAGYLGIHLPLGAFQVYTGVRFERNDMSLKSYTSLAGSNTKKDQYEQTDFFPSLNLTYSLNTEQLIRLAYGASINRQEFREVSASVYYDFDLFSDVKGNPGLKPAYIQNLDLRYEYYPSSAELVSVALFYKHFKDPVEWTYLDAGGSYTYTFENALSANALGIEIDIRKDFGWIGLPALSVAINGALIDSKVRFKEESIDQDRPMQGQSPYLINGGLFYQPIASGVTMGLLYNRIGKRIVGIGRADVSGGNPNNDIPDMYEMPRNSLDFTLSKKLGDHFEIRGSIRDVLSEDLVFKQFPKFTDASGQTHVREQITKQYRPGRSYTLSLSLSF